MKITINGNFKSSKRTTWRTCTELNTEGKLATALNENFIPLSERKKTTLKDGDRVEIVAPWRVARMVMFYGTELESRLMLGTSQYPSPAILEHAFKASNASVATVSLRREGRRAGQPFWDIIQQLGGKFDLIRRGAIPERGRNYGTWRGRSLIPLDKLEVIGNTDTFNQIFLAS